jgi:hypothetical protein
VGDLVFVEQPFGFACGSHSLSFPFWRRGKNPGRNWPLAVNIQQMAVGRQILGQNWPKSTAYATPSKGKTQIQNFTKNLAKLDDSVRVSYPYASTVVGDADGRLMANHFPYENVPFYL